MNSLPPVSCCSQLYRPTQICTSDLAEGLDWANWARRLWTGLSGGVHSHPCSPAVQPIILSAILPSNTLSLNAPITFSLTSQTPYLATLGQCFLTGLGGVRSGSDLSVCSQVVTCMLYGTFATTCTSPSQDCALRSLEVSGWFFFSCKKFSSKPLKTKLSIDSVET